MQAFTEPLDRLREALRWFVAVPELRLLHVVTGPELSTPALRMIAEAQTSAHNDSPFVFSVTPATGKPADWDARAAEIDEDMAATRESAAAATPPLVIGAPHPVDPSVTGLARFAATVQAHARVIPAPLRGLIVVLAPPAIAESATWVAALGQLVRSPTLSAVRFIVQEPDPGPSGSLASELASSAEHVDVRVDPHATTNMTAVMLAGMKTAPVGADPARLAGMAGPREAPPPRLGNAPPSAEASGAALSAAGVAPAMGDPVTMQALRIDLLSASLAQQKGQKEDAIRHQRDARDRAARAGLVKESVLLDLMLGAHLVQAGAYGGAVQVFDRVALGARAAALPTLEVQAHMAKGGVRLAEGRPEDAATVYTTGAKVAEANKLQPFAIECYRMVGQISSSQGNESAAATAFQRALAVAKDSTPLEQRTSSAPVAARDLAAIYRKNGLTVQADSLEAEAVKWQTELPKVPPVGALAFTPDADAEPATAADFTATAMEGPSPVGKGTS